MTAVLIEGGIFVDRHSSKVNMCEEKGSNQGDASASQRKPQDCQATHQKLGERHKLLPHSPWKEPTLLTTGVGPLVFRTRISVVQATQFMVHCKGYPSKLINLVIQKLV